MRLREKWFLCLALGVTVSALGLVYVHSDTPGADPFRHRLSEWGFGPLIQKVREPVTRPTILNNFKQIGLAFHNYASENRTLPAAAIYSKDGKPLLSWRVILLPYLEQQALYDQFHLDEPWDSPHNLTLLPKMPTLYHNYPDDVPAKPTATTNFRIFVGRGTAFEGPRGLRLGDFADGTSNTILAVETAESVPWTKPAEIVYAPECALEPLGSRYPDVFVVLLGDGAVRTLNRNMAEPALRAAITRNGREPFELIAP